jgi:hypothetical protein
LTLRLQLQRDSDATRAPQRQALQSALPGVRPAATPSPAARGADGLLPTARASTLSCKCRLCLSVTALLARPRPCAAGIQACWRQSRCLSASGLPPLVRGKQKRFVCPSLVVPPAWVRRAAWPPAVLARERSKTRRRGSFTVNVMAACLIMEGPFTPGRRKRQSSTLLVQAVPHASRLRQTASGQGLAALRAFTPAPHCCLRPHARLAL